MVHSKEGNAPVFGWYSFLSIFLFAFTAIIQPVQSVSVLHFSSPKATQTSLLSIVLWAGGNAIGQTVLDMKHTPQKYTSEIKLSSAIQWKLLTFCINL